jgi:hypothetical protein
MPFIQCVRHRKGRGQQKKRAHQLRPKMLYGMQFKMIGLVYDK